MAWGTVLLLALVGLTSADYGWKPGRLYRYTLNSTTMTGLHQVADQYSGVMVTGKVHIYVETDHKATAQIVEPWYADFNEQFGGGWDSNFSPGQLNFKRFPIQNDVFHMVLRKGLVEKLVVENETQNWELNFIKAIASQFQVDVQGQNQKRSHINILPNSQQHSGTYKTMEDSVSGVYETIYEVLPIPQYLVQSVAQLSPETFSLSEGDFYHVLKSRNFSSSDRHIVYHYGLSGYEGWHAGTNQMGNFFSRTSQSRILLSGSLNKYTIHSTVTTEKVIVAPHLYNTQKAIVVSSVNLTLESVDNKKDSDYSIDNPRNVEGLSYEFEQSTPQNGDSGEAGNSSSSSSSESSSQSSSSSSEEANQNQLNTYKRKTRSAEWSSSSGHQMKKSIQGQGGHFSSSSSSSSEDSSISSSEEYFSPPPELHEAPTIEFLPHYKVNKDQIVEQIVRHSRLIAQALQNPNNIFKDQVHSSYTYLTHLTGRANSQQLEESTEKLYYPEENIQGSANQESYHKYRSWQAYRDTVGEAGTGPALVEISRWINTGKVSENEGAQILAALPRAARYPTTEYMNYFFELVKSPQVVNQRYVNNSAILSFAELIRKSLVDGNYAHHHYSIHLTGANSQNHQKVAGDKYIPYLKAQLHKAAAKGDTTKILVYIKALAYTAHPDIWEGFEPYLEGQRNMTDHQRLFIIQSLDKMAQVHPKTTRAVLFRVLYNKADRPQIRAAAVMQIMKTNPSSQLVQTLAQLTTHDTSEHVRAAVKSAIESAANGDINSFPELAESARSSANLLTPESYGFDYPKNYIGSFTSEKYRSQYDYFFTYSKGSDDWFPKSVLYHLYPKIGGHFQEPQTGSFMSSSLGELFNLVFYKLSVGNHQKAPFRNEGGSNQKQGQSSEYTFDNINEYLNLENEQALQVEGNLDIPFLGAQRFFTFDNHFIEQIPEYVRENVQNLNKGFKKHETKHYNAYSMEMGFPLATGVALRYSYDEPSLMFSDVEAQGEVQQFKPEAGEHYQLPINASMNGTYQIVWSSLKSGILGFYAYDKQYKTVVSKQVLFNFPIKANSNINGPQNEIKFTLQPYSSDNKPQKFFQYSSGVSTTIDNLKDEVSYPQENNAQKVRVGQMKSFKKSYGEEYTGYHFEVEGQSENNFADVIGINRAIKSLDYGYLFNSLFQGLGHTYDNNNYAITYKPENSSPEQAVVRFYFNKVQHTGESKKSDSLRHHKPRGRKMRGAGNMAQPSSTDSRREELLANVYSDIPSAHAYIFDASASFGDKQNRGQYVLTGAYAESPVSEKSRFLAYYSGSPYQEAQGARPNSAAFQFNFRKPQIPVFNYKEAVKSDPTSYVHGQINFDNSEHSKIVLEGVYQRTEERKNYASQLPEAVACRQQMKENNFFQPACRNATWHANAPDFYNITVTYHDVPQVFQNATYGLYDVARYFGYQYNEENFAGVHNKEGQINFVAKLAEDLSYFNASINTPYFDSYFQNVEFHHYLRSFFIQYPGYNQLYMYSPYYFNTKPHGTCAVDASIVSTFNNRVYPINLEDKYYVLAIAAEPTYPEGSEESYETYYDYQTNYAVIAKEYGSQKKEVQVVLGNDAVTLKPSGAEGVSVNVNGEIFQTYANKVARWQGEKYQFSAYSLPGQSNVVLYFTNHSLEVYYDGYRVAISVSNDQKNKVRGLCGTFDGEPAYDFTTPQNCVVRDPQQFVASYVIPSSSYQTPANYQNAPCYPRDVVYADVVSDVEAGRAPRGKTLAGNDINQQVRGKQSCSLYKVQIVKDGGRSCFSLKPQVTCSSSCKASRKIEKHLEFHCVPDTDNLTGHWLRMIKQGANPDFSQKAANSRMRVMLPESCISS